ncbi:hypothetical protein V6N11_033697, partial [Hibiscus sabdariffa]
ELFQQYLPTSTLLRIATIKVMPQSDCCDTVERRIEDSRFPLHMDIEQYDQDWDLLFGALVYRNSIVFNNPLDDSRPLTSECYASCFEWSFGV